VDRLLEEVLEIFETSIRGPVSLFLDDIKNAVKTGKDYSKTVHDNMQPDDSKGHFKFSLCLATFRSVAAVMSPSPLRQTMSYISSKASESTELVKTIAQYNPIG
jgi:hypothetical protein